MAPHHTATATPFAASARDPRAYAAGGQQLARRALSAGVYVPTPCFFVDNESEDIDTATIRLHAVRLAQAGVAGLTVQGSNGEAVHLDRAERRLVTRTTRTALDAAGFASVPIIAGCGAQSVRETLALCRDAGESGADYALLLPPAYYKANYTRDSLAAYFVRVADQSPVPLLIYNFPGAAAGTDLDSDLLVQLASHPNIVGAKLTCGNVGKLARVAAATGAVTPRAPRGSGPAPFYVLAGSADFMLPSLAVEGSGALAGLANIAPKAHVQLFNAFRDGDAATARHLQAVLSRADWAVQRGGVVGTKAALQTAFGYGGFARAPLPRWGVKETKANADAYEELLQLEKEL